MRENRASHLVGWKKNSSYYIAPVGDRTHDLPHTVASNVIKVSHALYHSATAAVYCWSQAIIPKMRTCMSTTAALQVAADRKRRAVPIVTDGATNLVACDHT